MLTEGSMDTSECSSSPTVHAEKGRAGVTSFLLSTADGITGDERVTEDKYDVEERVIALVVPFGVVRVKTPGIAHLSTGLLFKGEGSSDFVRTCAMPLSDGHSSMFELDDGVKATEVVLVSSMGKGTKLICLWSQRAAFPTSTLRPRRLACL
jgi:hypothetical protein